MDCTTVQMSHWISVDLTWEQWIALVGTGIGAVMGGPMAVSAMGSGGEGPVLCGWGNDGDERGSTAEREFF